MALNKEAQRKQRRRELDSRRSKFRVRLGSWPESWSKLKDQLGFSLHSELAQFLLDSYSGKEYRTCSGGANEMISVTVASLDQLILLVHGHGQQCPLTPSLQSDSHRQEVKQRPLGENPATSTRSSKAGEADPGLTYVCRGGHTFTWSPARANWHDDGEKRGQGSAAPPGQRKNREQQRKEIKQEEVCRMGKEKGKAVSDGRSPNDGAEQVPPASIGENEEGCHNDAVQPEQEADSQEGSDAASLILPAKFSNFCTSSGSTKTDDGCQNIQDEIQLSGGSRNILWDAIPKTSTRGRKRRADVPETVETSEQRRKVSRKPISKKSKKDQFLQMSSGRKRKPTPNLILPCEFEDCGKIYSSRQHLNHHMKYQHFQPKTFTCSDPSCGKSFNFKKHLKEHEKLHSDQRDFICEFCARAFRTSSNLSIHRRIHTGEKPLQCEVCGFTCCQKASLNWHMRKHDAERSYRFACEICGRRFEKRDNVTAHQSKSHPDHVTSDPPKEPTVKDF